MQATTAPTDEPWDRNLFRAALVYHRVTYPQLARKLRKRGLRYSPHSVANWARSRSPGPPHPAVREALVELLPHMRR